MKYMLLIVISLQLCGATYGQMEASSIDSTGHATHALDVSKRKKVFAIAGISAYSAASVALYQSWYKNYERTGFHSYNDWGQWKNMDKAGHVYSAYAQSFLIHNLASWAGYDDDKALKIGTLSSLVGQLTIEVMDGFSKDWGFSWSDMGANLVGTGGYYIQEKVWGEQRLKMKMSYWPVSYDQGLFTSISGANATSLDIRANQLYGKSGIEKFLKDYNGQTIWVSADIKAFFPDSKWPDILDLAIGYSAKNLYGGNTNTWEMEGETFRIDDLTQTRSRQWVLALDYDLSSVYHSTKFGTALFKVLDIFKYPAPGVSYDSHNGWAFHLFFLN